MSLLKRTFDQSLATPGRHTKPPASEATPFH